jgi:hypothetical protein
MIELHIFTNCTPIIENKITIVATYTSFCNTFKCTPIPTIWVDPNPNRAAYSNYLKYLKENFPLSTIHKTNSLSFGYTRMIDETNSEFIFALEHDWVFNDNIKDDLSYITTLVKDNHICHLKFNQHTNDETYLPDNYGDYLAYEWHEEFCLTKSASNNPHILHVPTYRETARKYIKHAVGSMGVEHNLRNIDDCKFAIYGSKSLGPTITHIDGRHIGL